MYEFWIELGSVHLIEKYNQKKNHCLACFALDVNDEHVKNMKETYQISPHSKKNINRVGPLSMRHNRGLNRYMLCLVHCLGWES